MKGEYRIMKNNEENFAGMALALGGEQVKINSSASTPIKGKGKSFIYPCARAIIEQELSRLYYVLGKLQEKPLPPMEELALLLRIPTNPCDINPDLALIKVNADIVAYEAALNEVKGK